MVKVNIPSALQRHFPEGYWIDQLEDGRYQAMTPNADPIGRAERQIVLIMGAPIRHILHNLPEGYKIGQIDLGRSCFTPHVHAYAEDLSWVSPPCGSRIQAFELLRARVKTG